MCRKPYESSPVTQRRASCLKVPGRSLNADLESGTNTLSRTDATTSMHSQADTRRPSQQLRSYIRRLSINPSLVASNDSLTNSNRGLDAAQLSMNQRNFERLQTSLKQTDHLPYSLWPRRKSDISHLSPLSRSTQHHRAQRFSITPVLSTLERGDPTQDQGAPSSAPGCTSKSAIDKEVFKF